MTSQRTISTALRCLAIACLAAGVTSPAGAQRGWNRVPIVSTETLHAGGGTLQVDFTAAVDSPVRAAISARIQEAADAVSGYFGRFPVERARLVVMPVPGRHGVLQGTTWGNRDGFPALLRLRIGDQSTAADLAKDWILTHELTHPALADLPDDEHWLEEGMATYVEPIEQARCGTLAVSAMWKEFADGMPNGEPAAGDEGLNRTHTWGRTYWGGALFWFTADLRIRAETHGRHSLQDALRAIVDSGHTINTEGDARDVLHIADKALGTDILEPMYQGWSGSAVPVDLTQVWSQLGVVRDGDSIRFDDHAPLAGIRKAITNSK